MEKWSVSAQFLEQRSFKKLGFTNIYESLVLIHLYGVKYLRVLPLDKNKIISQKTYKYQTSW